MGVALSSNIRDHYSQTFGPFNQRVVIRNHTFICLDAPGLVDEDYQRSALGVPFEQWYPIPGGALEFINSVSRGTHIRYSVRLTQYSFRIASFDSPVAHTSPSARHCAMRSFKRER
jgi:hypothetical protein